MKAWLVILLATSVAFAGCGEKEKGGGDVVEPPASKVDPNALKDGMGAIQGLLIDDRYRPISDGLVLLQPDGLTAEPDGDGLFSFVDLAPGAYQIRVDVPGHDATSQTVQVEEGLVTEAHVIARRVISDNGTTLSQEYTVFSPCNAAVGGVYTSYGCLDNSGDSYRPGVRGIDFQNETTATYLVVEMKTEKEGHYMLSVRHDDGTPLGGESYGRGHTDGSDYTKAIMKVGEAYQNGSAEWKNDRKVAALLFYEGEGLPLPPVEVPGVATVHPGNTGASIGDKAQIVMTLFLGEPEDDVETFCVLC